MEVLAFLAALVAIAFAVSGRMRASEDDRRLQAQVADLRSLLNSLRAEVDTLRTRLRRGETSGEPTPETPAPEAPVQTTVPAAPKPVEEPAAQRAAPTSPFGQPPQRAAAPAAAARTSVPPVVPSTPPPGKPLDFEQQFGARLPVWVGGIALALAGIFLVKYSIDNGWLSPAVRCVLGGIFGIALLAAAQWLRARPAIANGERIAQALSGAGIAALYGVLFAATSLYALIAPGLGFAGMAIVTATAVVLSLRHGAPIAVLGLVGGFLTPLLVPSDEPNASVLFTYLFALTSGLFLLIRHRNWWWLAWPTIGAAFLWLGVWIAFFARPGDDIWLSLFLLASVAVVVGANARRAVLPYETASGYATGAPGPLGIMVLGAALLFMATITVRGHFDMSQWVLYGLLAIASIALAAQDERYRMAPWLSFAVTIVMLAVWVTPWTEMFAGTLVAFAVLFAASGYALLWRGRDTLSWGLLSAVSAVVFYLLAYARLKEFTDEWAIIAAAAHTTVFPVWGAIAMTLGALACIATGRVMEKFAGPESEKEQLLATFAVAATSFLALGLGIELKREYLSVALAAQVLTIAWVDTRVQIKALRYIAAAVAGAFAVMLVPQILLLIELTGYAMIETRLHAVEDLPVLASPTFQLGVPALLLAGASVLLRQRRDDAIVRAFEGGAIALLAVMGYYLIRYIFYSGTQVLFAPGTFFERGIITNVLFVYALALMWTAQRFARPAVMWGGLIIGGIAVFRVLFFDMLISSPLIVAHDVGSWPLINYLLLPYGLPVLWLWLGIRFSPRDIARPNERLVAPLMAGTALIFAFVLASLNVRQIYQGPVLNGSYTSDAEIYTYSFVWLIGGIALLFMGTLRKDKLMRYASLAVMILTVAKVFLYDASELTGLLRVISFFGLGLSLLGLSWFYTRFVFVPETRPSS